MAKQSKSKPSSSDIPRSPKATGKKKRSTAKNKVAVETPELALIAAEPASLPEQAPTAPLAEEEHPSSTETTEAQAAPQEEPKETVAAPERTTSVTAPGTMPVVLQVLPELDSGGVERGTIEIAKALKAKGYGSLVASAGGKLVHQLEQAGITHITLPVDSKNPFKIWRNACKLSRAIRKNGVNIVHARSRAPAWSAKIAAKRCRIPFLTTFHGLYSLKSKFKLRYNSVMTSGVKVIAISDFIRNHMMEEYGVQDERITVIHRCVDAEYFDPGKVTQRRLVDMMKKLHVPDDRQVILLPGRLTRWKGQHYLLEALKYLDKDSFFCLIVGDGSKHPTYRKELEDTIRQEGLVGSVRVCGSLLDMPALYALANVVVSASVLPEAFGRVVIEGQAMGKPVVATNHGGAKETIIDGKTGWLAPHDDAQAFAKVLQRALSLNEKERKEMGHAAREHMKEHFSLAIMAEKTLDVYHDILANHEATEKKA